MTCLLSVFIPDRHSARMRGTLPHHHMLDKHMAAKMVLDHGSKRQWLDIGNYAALMWHI
jgi:hypothetical protein